MRTIISRWFMFGLLIGWALTHATVFAQPAGKKADKGASSLETLRSNLDKTITLDYTANSLVEVLNHIREKAGVPINVDQTALMQMGIDAPVGNPAPVSVKAINEKVSQVLRKLLNPHQLSFIILEDALLVTTEESAVARQMRQRVSIDIEAVAFNKAVRELARNHGINLVIDPKVAKQAETAVTLQLDNAGIETTVRLLAELASLKSVRMGNVLFITTEEKAKKIRKEEPNPLDPFGPNLPPVIRGAGIGGRFGMLGGLAIPPAGGPARIVGVQELVPPAINDAPPPIQPGAKKLDLSPAPPRIEPPPVIQRATDPVRPAPRRQSVP